MRHDKVNDISYIQDLVISESNTAKDLLELIGISEMYGKIYDSLTMICWYLCEAW